MKEFGVVYIHSGGIWSEICEVSQTTLPKGTEITVLRVANHEESLRVRLSLAGDLPYRRTLYLDCDTVYCQKAFPEWLTQKLIPTGITMSAWRVTNQVWSWPSSWAGEFCSIEELVRLPHWFRTPNAGLMLLESHCDPMLTRWRESWQSLATPLIEPAYADAFANLPQQFDLLPADFHVPSTNVGQDFIRLPEYHFIHAIVPTHRKIDEMFRVLTEADQCHAMK